jgi:shikimate dehydrogenase
MTDCYAVIGNPIAHSKSPQIHLSFAQATGQDVAYTAIEGPLDGVEATIRAFQASGGRGMNVTAPFKLRAYALADSRSARSELAGAANALRFEGGRIAAENFDGVGLVNDIQSNLGVSLRGKRVLFLGAGGAVRGALLPFLEQNPSLIAIANRTVEKAERLAHEVRHLGTVAAGSYADMARNRFDVVINATSASLSGELPPVSPDAFGRDTLAYELVYGKAMTPFLTLARNAGTGRLADGVGMLVEQAAEAFSWWRGVRPDTKSLINRFTVPLA